MKNVKNFREHVEACVNEKPLGICFTWLEKKDEKNKTYTDFLNDINALGTFFYYNGLKNAKIGVIGENSYEWILTYFTTVIGGNVIVPIDRDLKADAIINIIKSSGVKALVYSDSIKLMTDEIKKATGVRLYHKKELATLISEGKALLNKGKTKYLSIKINEKAMSTIIYTSGTTGKPKGVMLSQFNIISDAIMAANTVKIFGSTMLVLPLHHTYGFTTSVVAVMLFRETIAINKNLRTFQTDMQYFKPENMFLVPMFVEAMHKKIWKNIADKKATKLMQGLIKTSNGLRKIGIDKRDIMFKTIHDSFGGNLKTLISGGAALDPLFCKAFDDIGINLLNGYGITECSPVVTVNSNNGKDKNKFGSVGLVYTGVSVRIMNADEDGNGEIFVKGDNVMLGYYNNKKATAEAFVDGWFNTGDIGYLDDENYLYIAGRSKNLIILSNGKNIYPEELEELILRIPDAIEAVVYNENEVITAEIYTENPAAVELAIRDLNKGLPIYKHIKSIKFRTTEFEKTSTKKIKRMLVTAK